MTLTDVSSTSGLVDADSLETGAGTASCPDPLSRWVLVAIVVVFLVTAFAQAWGKIETDTELPLIMSPTAFIHAALHAWDPAEYGGFVNTQTVGLIFPMGLFFNVAHVLHVPVWWTERIWLALLLTVGCWGVARLCESLGIGSRWARVLAGLAYCVTPIVVTWVTTSASLLAVVLLPWVLIPLVWGSRGGSPRRAAALSGAAIALMGGGNATVIVAVLPVAAIWLLTRQPGPRRRSLMGWWVAAVFAACFWWLAPLIVTSGDAYNYLPFSETPAVTTSTASAFESLRGASFWLDYYALGGPLIPGAWTIVSSTVVIIGTTVVTALGLAGLCRRIPERLFLVGSLCLGVVVIAVGYVGSGAGPFGHVVQQELGSSLAPLRSVGKFSPAVALPLAIGLAFVVSKPIWSRIGARHSRSTRSRRLTTVLVGGVAVAAVVIAATPFWRLDLYKAGGFSAIPNYWSQTGTWLDHHQGRGTALLVPGASFADYTWGNSSDEPLQVTSDTSVQWRNLIPLGSNGNTQVLETVEQVLDSGLSPPGFAQFLSREGFDYVVERNDLNLAATGAPSPAQVHEVLSNSPGLREVASFGPLLSSEQTSGGDLPVFGSSDPGRLRSVEIFQVLRRTSGIHTYPVADPLVVSGDAGSLLPIAGANLLTGRAAVLAGDPLAADAPARPLATWVITDGDQRRDQLLGTIRDNLSYLLGPGQRVGNASPSAPLGFVVVPGEKHQTVEAPIGVASLSASSYGSYSFVSFADQGPEAAFDGNPFTAWVANSSNNSVGQSISVTLDHPRDLKTITIDPLDDTTERPTVSQITITTDRGSVRRSLAASKAPQIVTAPSGPTRTLTIRIDKVRRPTQASPYGKLGAGFTNIVIPGVTLHLRMKTPTDEASNFAESGRPTPLVVLNSPPADPNLDLGQAVDTDPDMARLVTIPQAMDAHFSGTVLPEPGPALNGIMDQVAQSTAPILISASSSLGNLPQFRPENLVERSGTPWIAGLSDSAPFIDLLWGAPVSVSSLRLTLTPSASPPTQISISDGNETRIVNVPKDGGLVTFPAMTTNGFRISFINVTHRLAVVPSTTASVDLPVGLASLSVPAVTSKLAPTPALGAPVQLPCGAGPTIMVDGKSIPTAVSGTFRDLVDLLPMAYTPCTRSGTVPLSSGPHDVKVVQAASAFQGASLTASISKPAIATSASRRATLTRWAADSRTISLSAGPATYLAVAQNYSAGWKATLDGRALQPIRLDGWQQGYLVPAGAAGSVVMSMAPNAPFDALLSVGALLLVALLLLALIPGRRVSAPLYGPRVVGRPVLLVASAAILVVVAGPWALVAVPALLAARRWGPNPMAVVAFGAFVVAGVAVALNPGSQPILHTGAFGYPAQIASEIALAAVLSAVVMAERQAMNPPPPDN